MLFRSDQVNKILSSFTGLDESTRELQRAYIQSQIASLGLSPEDGARKKRLAIITAPEPEPGQPSSAETAFGPGRTSRQRRPGTRDPLTSTREEKYDALAAEYADQAASLTAQLTKVGDDADKRTELEGKIAEVNQKRAEAIRAKFAMMLREADAMLSLGAASGDADAYAAAVQQKYDAIIAQTDISDPEKQAQVQQLRDQQATQNTQNATRDLRVQKAGTRDAVTIANLDLQIAQKTLAEAKRRYKNTGNLQASKEAITAAEIGVKAAELGQIAANEAKAEQARAERESAADKARAAEVARRQLGVTRINPIKKVAVAKANLAVAANEQQYAASRFGRNSAEYYSATAAFIEAQRQVDDAIQEVVEANVNLSVAIATAAGNTVEVARLQLAAALAAVRAAAKKGGKGTAEYKNARAEAIQARANLRDAQLEDARGTIDFQKQMGIITAQEAIRQLQELLKQKNLTRDQRRALELEIKGLQDELNAQFEGIWNIGDEIKMPTPYEVRRTIGVAAAQKAVGGTVRQLQDEAAAAYSNSGAPSGTSATVTTQATQAIRELAGAISAKGDSITNDNSSITINGTDVGMVLKLITNALGPVSSQRSGTTTRKGG